MCKLKLPAYGERLVLDKPLYIIDSVSIDLPSGCILTQHGGWVTVWSGLDCDIGFTSSEYDLIEIDGCYKLIAKTDI